MTDPAHSETGLETPERVGLNVDYAGVGSRAMAQFLDLGAITGTLGVVGLVCVMAWPAVGVLAGIVFLVLAFLVFWFYFALFEILWHGQTPGKRVVGLRVQKDGGYPIDATAALVRNLVRVVDAILVYAVGLVVMLLTAKSQRVGDLAAGTVVVRELSEGAGQLDRLGYGAVATAAASAGGTPLGAAEYELLHEFLGRRASLEPRASERIEAKLAAGLRHRLRESGYPAGAWERLSDAELLRHLAGTRGAETAETGR